MDSEKTKTEAAASGKEKSAPEMAEPLETINLIDEDIDQNDNQDQNGEGAAVENGGSSPSSSEWGDDSSDDDIPLGRRAPIAAGGSTTTASGEHPPEAAEKKKQVPEQPQEEKKRSQGSAVDTSDSDAPLKKRRFAPAKKGGKCGTCDNCKNPHWKKACIEVRKAQEAAAAAGNSNGATASTVVKTTKTVAEKPAAVKKTPAPTPPAPPAPPAPAAAAAAAAAAASAATTAKPLSNDQFTKSLGKLMAAGGSIVQSSHVPVLIDLMKRASTWGQRQSILTTMVLSVNDVLAEIVQQKGLLVLQKWFSEAIEGKRPKSLASLMTTLDALPISMAALQPPCELGKLVGNLRKAPEELHALKPQAAALVNKWKAIVKQRDAAVPAVEKAASAAAAATAKAVAAAAETKAATTKAAAADASKQKSKTTTTITAPSSSKLGDDIDLFGAADKRRAGAATAAAAPKQAKAADAAVKKPTTASKRPMLSAKKIGADASQSTSSSLLPTVSVSSLSSLGGGGAGGLGGSGPVSSSSNLVFGSHHVPLMMTGADRARQRAKEAAARVPSPEPVPRKEKKKKLVWKDVNELEAIRWFRKADPPSAARQDVDLEAFASTTREPSPPPQFASAAKKEHLSEAHALRAHRQEEDEFRAKYIELLAEMVSDLDWYDPPTIAAATAGGTTIALGEQSYEAAAAKARRAGLHPGAPVPTYPLEPNGSERRRPQPLHSIPRIPLSTEEARLWAAQAQSQQEERQRQFARVGGGPPLQQQQKRYAPPLGAVGAPQQAPAATAPVALPDGLSAAIAQLAASGALPPAPTTNAANTTGGAQPPPPGLQRTHHQPPPRLQQHHQRPPPRAQPRGPVLPPGMRPMLGLHRPAQPPPIDAPDVSASAPQPPTQHHMQSMNSGIGGVGGRSRTPCRFFLSPEGCRHGNNCRFAHLPVDQAAKRPRVDAPGGAPGPLPPGFGAPSRY